jgi:hypothetical protein
MVSFSAAGSRNQSFRFEERMNLGLNSDFLGTPLTLELSWAGIEKGHFF